MVTRPSARFVGLFWEDGVLFWWWWFGKCGDARRGADRVIARRFGRDVSRIGLHTFDDALALHIHTVHEPSPRGSYTELFCSWGILKHAIVPQGGCELTSWDLHVQDVVPRGVGMGVQ